jgi:2-dehydro-3-deoxyphosphogluconate aldolase / (4S)-4-hydroxy-2-oxoglutarate aldolase
MATFTKTEVLQTMKDTGMVPLFYHANADVAIKTVQCLYEGGARLLEFTNRGDFAQDVYHDLALYVNKNLPEMILGVGSVTDQGTASLYMQMGANFVVTPVYREDVARVCNRKNILWSPGCGSLTEITAAEEMGCDLVKLFPAGTYGPKFISDIRGPQPWTKIMPTGGVSPTEENLKGWFSAGAFCVGMGSQLIAKKADGSFDYDKIKTITAEALAIIKKIRS